LQDWRDIYQPELKENPPPEAFLAGYFGYEAPMWPGSEPEQCTLIESDLPEYEA